MSNRFKTIVVGGGIVGLTAAIGMQEKAGSVAIIDAGPMSVNLDRMDARVYAVNQTSEALFKALGVWDCLQHKRLQPYQGMYVWDAETNANIAFDSRLIGTHRLGHIIEESVVKDALLARALEVGVQMIADQKVTAIHPLKEHAEIHCSDKIYHADLLMIADGARSMARELLSVPMTEWSYHQHAIVTRVQIEKPHQNTAWQIFNPDGPLAFLPLCDSHQCSIVWSTRPKMANQLTQMNDEDFNRALERAFHKKLGECKVLEQRIHFPLMMRHVNQYCGDRWILMGDAAHTIHPLAGLGLNLGLEDVATWLQLAGSSKPAQYSASRLKKYQRERKHAVWKMILIMQGLKSVFSSPIPAIKNVRSRGLQVINHMPAIKKFFIHQASGNNI